MDEITPLITKIQAKHWLRLKPSPWVLYPALLVLGFAIGMIQGPSVQFIMDITCDRIDSTKVASRPREQCNSDPQVQALVSNLLMIMQLVCSITGLLTTAIYSRMSDTRGRRPVIVINALGFICDLLANWLLVRFKETAPLWILLVGSFFQGLGGSSSTLLMSCHAYCADCTSPTERTVAFGRLMASFISGSLIGPTVAGWMMEATGTIEPIVLITLGIFTLWMLFAIVVLPESNTKQKIPEVVEDNSQPNGSFLSNMQVLSVLSIIFTAKPELANNAALPILSLISFLCKFATMSYTNILVLYVTYVFAWTPADVGYFLSFENGASLVGLLCVLPMVKKIHQTVVSEDDSSITARHSTIILDIVIARAGLMFLAVSMLIFAVAHAGWVMFLGGFLQIGGCLYLASIKSLMVQLAGEENAGLILGAAAVLDSITYAAGPLISSILYSHFVSTIPWIVFALCGGLFTISAILSLFIRARPLHTIRI